LAKFLIVTCGGKVRRRRTGVDSALPAAPRPALATTATRAPTAAACTSTAAAATATWAPATATSATLAPESVGTDVTDRGLQRIGDAVGVAPTLLATAR
jgi:hypothetical protein